MADQELFYRNVMIDHNEREEAVVKVSKGYGIVVELILEGGTMETAIRLTAAGALALGEALNQAGNVATRA
jgi:hypothetical protein